MHNAQGIITRVKGQAGAGWGQLKAGIHVKQGSTHTKDVGVVRYKQQQQPRKQSEHMHIYYTYFAHASGQAGAGWGKQPRGSGLGRKRNPAQPPWERGDERGGPWPR